MSMYRRYEVLECLCEIWADNADATSAQIIGLSVRSTSTALVDRDDLIENRTALLRHIGGSNGSPSTIHHKIAVTPSTFLGLKAGADDTLRGVQSANPSSGVFIHVSSIPMKDVDVADLRVQARLTFKVKLSEPKEPASS
jgi:hypothetical protein